MKTLFNDNWSFAEYALDEKDFHSDDKLIFYKPQDFYSKAQSISYKPVTLPHDWMICHTKDLYKNSVGFYKKTISLSKDEITDSYLALRFEGVYMNSGVWINGNLACTCRYGYSTFEADITPFVKQGENQILVIAVYQNCNTRWYSGAGIFRDVHFIKSQTTHFVSDGAYFVAKKTDEEHNKWQVKIASEIAGNSDGCTVRYILTENKSGKLLYETTGLTTVSFEITNPLLWDIESPDFYILTIQLLDSSNNVIDEACQHCGFKTAIFTSDKGFFLNGRHVKINGACQHHDLGALGSAFDVNALKRQFLKLKEMGVNSIRCSHNPPASAFMDLADEMGLMIDDEAFDMWEKPKTPFDYGNYFNDDYKKDCASWVRRDRNHPSLIMWSIGNEIYDTHIGNGQEITKKLYDCVSKNDPEHVAPITIASNYMMTDGAQECAKLIDTVGYNYLERLYDEHHKKYADWKIYGSETGSTVQSRGIYHFPDSLKLVTFSDGQCSTLGNCTTPWGAANSQTVICTERDCSFSAGQYIWTGWDYIGEPTPYHTKNSYFGQIDTAGFEKDTFWLYKSEWAGKSAEPFVHLLPYWDWNEGQLIDVKAYTNASFVELFFNDKSLGKHHIDHNKDKNPFGQWKLEYHKGTIKAIAYDEYGKIIAQDSKSSFEDPASIVLKPESYETGNLYFIDIMTADKNGIPVENARNYITISVSGNATLLGMDNGDSTDYEEYQPKDGKTHTRRLFANRMVAIIKADKRDRANFTITAASKDLPNTGLEFTNGSWKVYQGDGSLKPEKDFIPTRKIEIIADGSTKMNKQNKEINVTCKVLPENATLKSINWNPVLKECVPSDYIQVKDINGIGTGLETAAIIAQCDGECILRCTAQNNTKLDEVLSDLPFTVSGVGNPMLNPYKIIEACRFSSWDQTKDKPKICLESGISTRGTGPNWISFDKVDFGKDGADTIHIPIFSFETELPLEIWDGRPGDGTTYEGSVENDERDRGKCQGRLLGKFIYKHESIYNTYNENIYTLKERLFGTHTISVVFPHELYFHGFYFDQTPKATAKLRALDATVISGDSFTRTAENVEGIGNNVSLDFENMNFGTTKIKKLILCGKSNTQNNTINIKFFAQDGTNSTQVIEFAHTSDYEEKTFELSPVSGNQKISFVFLPGSNFDFKWFKFE